MSIENNIKPINWVDTTGENGESYIGETPFGTIRLSRLNWRGESEFRMDYVFEEYYDEYNELCGTLENGKQIAQKLVEDRLEGFVYKRAEEVK